MNGDDEPEGTTGAIGDHPVPEPTADDLAVELIRDAVGVARGELSDEAFAEKYDIDSSAGTDREPESSE